MSKEVEFKDIKDGQRYDMKDVQARSLDEILGERVLIKRAWLPSKTISDSRDAVCYEIADKGVFLTISKVLFDQFRLRLEPALKNGNMIWATFSKRKNYLIME